MKNLLEYSLIYIDTHTHTSHQGTMIFIFAWNYNFKNIIYFLNEKILFLHTFVIRVHNI
jgi:hypothetical protein